MQSDLKEEASHVQLCAIGRTCGLRFIALFNSCVTSLLVCDRKRDTRMIDLAVVKSTVVRRDARCCFEWSPAYCTSCFAKSLVTSLLHAVYHAT